MVVGWPIEPWVCLSFPGHEYPGVSADWVVGLGWNDTKKAGKLAKAEKRKQELKKIGAGYKKDSASGKMIIDESETEVHGKKGKEGASASTNAFLEAIHGADGFRRDARGAMKPNKKRKQDPSLDHDDEEEDEDDDEQKIQEAVQGFHIGERDSAANKKKKVKRVKERLGAEFKAKVCAPPPIHYIKISPSF
jgi:hypothetical protein